ncbi:MAG: nucleotide exchange factor GrpE [Anaerolineales bacterium]|jgi:molecular chaperone GrpE
MAETENEVGPLQEPSGPIASSEEEIAGREGAQIGELQSQLQEAQRQAAENLDGWKRTQAEFANFRKRLEREQADARARMTGRVMGRLFPILDDFECALKEEISPEALGRWVAGVKLIHEKILGVLAAEGVEPIADPGHLFDPSLHEALSYEPRSGCQDGQVIEVMRPGYRLGEIVLRPALVRVACSEAKETKPSPSGSGDHPQERS